MNRQWGDSTKQINKIEDFADCFAGFALFLSDFVIFNRHSLYSLSIDFRFIWNDT